jgi:hypothetical protein
MRSKKSAFSPTALWQKTVRGRTVSNGNPVSRDHGHLFEVSVDGSRRLPRHCIKSMMGEAISDYARVLKNRRAN